MISRRRLFFVLGAYFILGITGLAIPVLLIFIHAIPHRFQLGMGLYVVLPLLFFLRNFLLGGVLSPRLTVQINTHYGEYLKDVKKRFVDLHCMSLLRIAGVWLVFPATWFTLLLGEPDAFAAYEKTLDGWLELEETATKK
jgi:hypothetical protein